MNSNRKIHVNRNHKSSFFTKLFGENKDNALSLYNAVNKSHYTNADDLIFTTIDDVIFMKQKNDVSFLFAKSMNLYEHQSTFNPNMPLRGFFYYADLYRQHIVKPTRIYGKNLVHIPAPNYIVFYNGPEKDFKDEVRELHLSDAFDGPTDSTKYEWTATMLNINYGHNKALFEQCRILEEYAILIDRIKSNSQRMSLEDAADIAVTECIRDGILEPFLTKHQKEVINMILTEFDEEEYKEVLREDYYTEGKVDAILDFLGELGPVPDFLSYKLYYYTSEQLRALTKLAARVDSVDEFVAGMSEV